eukprot:13968014-Alexandrium_andersonii.AAC.1
MSHSGQPPAERGAARQRAVQAASAPKPPNPRARATQAAPSDATPATGRQPLHRAAPAKSGVG